MVPRAVARYLDEQGLGQASGSEAAGGGCINHGRVITTTRGARFFLKTNEAAPPDMFEREAEGLRALGGTAGGPRVPRPYLFGADFLLAEYLAPEPPTPDYWPKLGERLARLHLAASSNFGFEHDNYIGLTPQPNPRENDGYRFFAEHRLRYQGRLCRQRGRLSEAGARRLDRLAERLDRLIPQQPASLVHGDLWSGNIIAGPGGEACLIDPAAHFGWAEADLAMMALFGQPPESFYSGYVEVRRLAPGYRERFEIYNLYHLLNHALLFGGGYGGEAEAVLRRYA